MMTTTEGSLLSIYLETNDYMSKDKKLTSKKLYAAVDGDSYILVGLDQFGSIPSRDVALIMALEIYSEIYSVMDDDKIRDFFKEIDKDFDLLESFMETLDILEMKYPGLMNQIRSYNLKVCGKTLFLS